MNDFKGYDETIDGVYEGKTEDEKRRSKGELINTSCSNSGILEQVTQSSEQKRAQKKAERIYFDSELEKLSNSLKYETEKHRVYHEELTKQKIAEIRNDFGDRIDRLYLIKQESKKKVYNEAIRKANEELERIEKSNLKSEMKYKLINRINAILDETLNSLDH